MSGKNYSKESSSLSEVLMIFATVISMLLCLLFVLITLISKDWFIFSLLCTLLIISIICLIGYYSKKIDSFGKPVLLLALTIVVTTLYSLDVNYIEDIATIAGVSGFLFLLIEKTVDRNKK